MAPTATNVTELSAHSGRSGESANQSGENTQIRHSPGYSSSPGQKAEEASQLLREADVFLELSFFFDDPTDVGNLTYGSFAFSKSSLNIWKLTVHILLKPGLDNFDYYFASV